MDLIFAFLAGLLTMAKPCVLPILPILAASAMAEDRRAPLWIALGLASSATALGFGLTVLGHLAGLTGGDFAWFGAVMLIVFGIILLLPQRFSPFNALTPLAGRATAGSAQMGGSALAHFSSGVLLGLAWSPCIGPTLGAAIALASTGENLTWSFLVMASYGAGLVAVLTVLAYGGREVIKRRKDSLQRVTRHASRVMGVACVAIGLTLVTKSHMAVEIWLIQNMPDWLFDLTYVL